MKALYFSTAQEALLYLQEKSGEQKLYVLFSSVDLVKELAQKVASNVILCSTSGEYTPNGYTDGSITGFECGKEDSEIVEILYPPILSAPKLKQAYDKVKSNPNAFMMLLCDGLSGMEESIMTTLYFMSPDFKVIGGSAGDNLQFNETYIYIGSERVRNVAIFFNTNKRTSLIKENIYTKTGETLLVSKADVLNRTVYSFNNQPASAEYARLLGVKEEELGNHFMNHPLGKVYENDLFIASPMKVNEDQSITFYCELMANTFVHLLKPENPLTILQQTIKHAPFQPSFVFAVNCILRSLMFLQTGFWGEFHREMINFCGNVTGFVSYGEQYYKNHSNQTMVLLLVE